MAKIGGPLPNLGRPWERQPLRTGHRPQRNGSGSLGRTSAWTRPALGCRTRRGAQRYCSAGRPLRWQAASASSGGRWPRVEAGCAGAVWPAPPTSLPPPGAGSQHPGDPFGVTRCGPGADIWRRSAEFESLFLHFVWGATRLSRAQEIVFSILTPGHRIPRRCMCATSASSGWCGWHDAR